MAGVRLSTLLLRGREIVVGGNSAPRGKHVYYRIASNRAGSNKRVKDVKLVESEREREREKERERGSSVRLEFSAIRYGNTPEIIIVIKVVVCRVLFFIDSSSCHSWFAEFLYLALLPRSYSGRH